MDLITGNKENTINNSVSNYEVMVEKVNDLKNIDLNKLSTAKSIPDEINYQLTFISNSIDKIRLLDENDEKEKQAKIVLERVDSFYKVVKNFVAKEKDKIKNHARLLDYIEYKKKRMDEVILSLDLTSLSTLEQVKFKDYISKYNYLLKNVDFSDYDKLVTLASSLDSIGNKIEMANNFINVKYDNVLEPGLSK